MSTDAAVPERGASLGRAIGASHLSWKFDSSSTTRLSGKVTSRTIGPLRVSWIRLGVGMDYWRGERTATDIKTNPEPYLTLVMPLHGSINLTAPARNTQVSEKEIALWDSSQPMAFDLACDNYEQISVLVPQRILRATSEACCALHCQRIDENNILAELCTKHMATMAEFLDTHLRPYELSLTQVTTSLADALVNSMFRPPRNRDQLLVDIQNYIECYIDDEMLAPNNIAAAFEISTRYLHKLFAPGNITVNQWIINRRLERSVDDLTGSALSVTDIAFKWGFKALGHYSRTFKSRFGVSPSEYRHNNKH